MYVTVHSSLSSCRSPLWALIVSKKEDVTLSGSSRYLKASRLGRDVVIQPWRHGGEAGSSSYESDSSGGTKLTDLSFRGSILRLLASSSRRHPQQELVLVRVGSSMVHAALQSNCFRKLEDTRKQVCRAALCMPWHETLHVLFVHPIFPCQRLSHPAASLTAYRMHSK